MTTTATRDRILRTAHDLFYSDGFHTVGLDRILAQVGVTKTTFYNHFPSKEDLVLEVLRLHDRWWRDHFRQMLRRRGGDTPRGQLAAIPDALEETITSRGFNGCFFINVAVQFPLPHDPAHHAAAEHKRAMEDLLREIAGYAGAANPAALAAELSLIMEGAYVTRQVSGSPRASDTARRLCNLILREHLGPAPDADR